MARNAAAGPPSTARWSKVRQACSVGRTAIAPSPTTTGRSLDASDPEDPALRRVEDRRRDVDRVDAAVRHGERAAGEVVGGERAVARAGRELGDARVDLLDREPVGTGDDRGDEPVVGLDGDGDVDLRRATRSRSRVTRALSIGCSRSAAATSFTTIAVTPIRGVAPSAFSRRAARRAASRRARAPRSAARFPAGSRPSRVAIVRAVLAAGIVLETVSRGRRRRTGSAPRARASRPGGDVAVDDPAAGPGAADLARVLEREAELPSAARARAARRAARGPGPARAGAEPARERRRRSVRRRSGPPWPM